MEEGFRIPSQTARLFPEGVEPGEVEKSVWEEREGGAVVPMGEGLPDGSVVEKSVWGSTAGAGVPAGDGVVSPHVIGRLLEDGDRADLRWLFTHVPEEAAAAWLRERGGRQLSGRSRAFWEVVLGVPAGPAAEAARELWPL